MKRTVVSIIIICLFTSSLPAQQAAVNFERLNIQDGLSHSIVNAVYQDHQGFLWVGTGNGLNRYDGYSFKTFRVEQDKANSIGGNNISCLYEDSHHILWIGTMHKGLSAYNPRTETFKRYPLSSETGGEQPGAVTTILEDTHGNLWVAMGNNAGMYRFNPQKNRFEHVRNLFKWPESLTKGWINDLCEDDRQNLWIAASSGLWSYNLNSRELKHHTHNPNDPKLVPSPSVQALCYTSEGLWLGRFDGLAFFDKQLDKIIHVDPPVNIPSVYQNPTVTEITADHKGRLWINYVQVGLCRYHPKTQTARLFTGSPYDRTALATSWLSDIYIDQNSILWIGTVKGGLAKLNLERKAFDIYRDSPDNPNGLNDNNITALHEDRDTILWIGTESGQLARFDRQKSEIETFYKHASRSDPTDLRIGSITEDHHGCLWLVSWGSGLYQFDKKNYRFIHYNFDSTNTDGIASWAIRKVYQTRDSLIWITTMDAGLFCFMPQAPNKKSRNFKQFHHIPNDEATLPDNALWTIYEDSKGLIWIGTDNSGLVKMERETNKYTTYSYDEKNPNSLSSNSIRVIYEDNKGRYWIGTSDGGLNRFDPDKETFKSYNEKDGLPNTTVYGILEDQKGRLWISTEGGLSCFDPEKETFVNYDAADWVQSSEFNMEAYCQSKTGHLMFGGIDGLTIFHPKDIKQNKYMPPVVITAFKIMNQPVAVGELYDEQTILHRSINFQDTIRLPYHIKLFSFDFAALDFTAPHKIRYKYILKGFNTDWIETDYNNRTATFTKLEPGTYTLYIKATNSDGLWSSYYKELTIIIEPPFWMTLWFKLLVIFLTIGTIIIFYIVRVQRIKWQNKQLEIKVREQTETLTEHNEEIMAQNKELEYHRNHLEQLVYERTIGLEEARKRAEEADRLKTAFLTNMSHEIRTPMNAIVGFANLLNEDHIDSLQKKHYVNYINQNAETLLALINDILNISKIEAGQEYLNIDQCDINNLLLKLLNDFQDKNTNKAVELILNPINLERNLMVYTDQLHLKRILTNLLSNALKFTKEGYVEFGFTIQKEKDSQTDDKQKMLQFYVKDTGIGIDKEQLTVIFDRFRKIDEDKTKLFRGAGLGLTLCKKLVDLFGGRIWGESTPGEGSVFFFTIPYIKSKPPVSHCQIEENENENDYPKAINWAELCLLVVEDEITNFKVLDGILSKTQIKVLWAKNGQEAVEMCRENHRIDIVLMDIKMPVMDGYQALKAIKDMYPDLPVVAQTAYALPEEEAKIKEAGFNAYLSKPIDQKKLFDKMSTCLSNT